MQMGASNYRNVFDEVKRLTPSLQQGANTGTMQLGLMCGGSAVSPTATTSRFPDCVLLPASKFHDHLLPLLTFGQGLFQGGFGSSSHAGAAVCLSREGQWGSQCLSTEAEGWHSSESGLELIAVKCSVKKKKKKCLKLSCNSCLLRCRIVLGRH